MSQVGALVRDWRTRRRLSQADLADQAEVSTRHLSCIERGRAHPSREMVLVLASALDVPLRERNTLLQAAGFAPAYRETDLGDPQMAQVRQALDLVLAGHEPYAAVVVDRTWDVVRTNAPWRLLAAQILGRTDGPPNLLRAIFDPDGLRPHLVNWEEVARATLQRLRREATVEGDEALLALYHELRGRAPDHVLRDEASAPPPLLIPVRLRVGDTVLSLFTTLTTLGTPTDVTLSELRIEQYFPADAATAAWVRDTVAPLLGR
ncbi:MAG: helix-turn-helix transcriptional regulator [Myxococcota bacterium]